MSDTLTARLLTEIERREKASRKTGELEYVPYTDADGRTRVAPRATPMSAHQIRELAYLAALRKAVIEIAGWHHFVLDDDCWYTCPAATEENDGGECCDDDRRDAGYCDCGLEWRRGRLLLSIAEALGVEA